MLRLTLHPRCPSETCAYGAIGTKKYLWHSNNFYIHPIAHDLQITVFVAGIVVMTPSTISKFISAGSAQDNLAVSSPISERIRFWGGSGTRYDEKINVYQFFSPEGFEEDQVLDMMKNKRVSILQSWRFWGGSGTRYDEKQTCINSSVLKVLRRISWGTRYDEQTNVYQFFSPEGFEENQLRY